jgi:hypothetical protein
VFGIVPKDPSIDSLSIAEGAPLSSIEDHIRFGFTHVRSKVHENIERARASYKRMADRSVRRDQEFREGDRVMIKARDGDKFAPRFNRPVRVLRVINPASLWVVDEFTTREFSVNVDKCKRYIGRSNAPVAFDLEWNDSQVDTQERTPEVVPLPVPYVPADPFPIPHFDEPTQAEPQVPGTPRRRGDSNPARRPIPREPYMLRDRKGSK